MVDVLGRTVVKCWLFRMEQLSNSGCFGRLVWVMKANASPRATDGVLCCSLNVLVFVL